MDLTNTEAKHCDTCGWYKYQGDSKYKIACFNLRATYASCLGACGNTYVKWRSLKEVNKLINKNKELNQMIKSKHIELPTKISKVVYPCIMRSTVESYIVLFTEKGCGVVIKVLATSNPCAYVEGTYIKNWCMGNFIPYYGDVILTSTKE